MAPTGKWGGQDRVWAPIWQIFFQLQGGGLGWEEVAPPPHSKPLDPPLAGGMQFTAFCCQGPYLSIVTHVTLIIGRQN